MKASDCARGLTIVAEIEGLKTFRVRMFFGSLLLRLGSKVVGSKLEIRNDMPEPVPPDDGKELMEALVKAETKYPSGREPSSYHDLIMQHRLRSTG